MLGISQKRDDATRCRYCGEKLSLLQRLSRAEYCNPQHREAYARDQIGDQELEERLDFTERMLARTTGERPSVSAGERG